MTDQQRTGASGFAEAPGPSLDRHVERVTDSVKRQRFRFPGAEAPTAAQIGMVLHAIADHTLNVESIYFSESDYPATNVGRWNHALGDAFDEAARANPDG